MKGQIQDIWNIFKEQLIFECQFWPVYDKSLQASNMDILLEAIIREKIGGF